MNEGQKIHRTSIDLTEKQLAFQRRYFPWGSRKTLINHVLDGIIEALDKDPDLHGPMLTGRVEVIVRRKEYLEGDK